jgi:tetratricopeptide (TPR) repeat protein
MTECPPQQLLPEAEHFKNKGNSAFASRDFQQAVAQYTRAIGLSPHATYFSNRSAAYFQLKEYEKAHLDAAKAAELDPNFVKVRLFRWLHR